MAVRAASLAAVVDGLAVAAGLMASILATTIGLAAAGGLVVASVRAVGLAVAAVGLTAAAVGLIAGTVSTKAFNRKNDATHKQLFP